MATIVLVDDDLKLRTGFEKLLAGEGYSVQSAETGEEGIEIVRSCAPDLLILDVRLPRMNGIEALRAIRRIQPKLPVIMMTAYRSDEAAATATELGAFAFVLKPFDISAMLNLIQQAFAPS